LLKGGASLSLLRWSFLPLLTDSFHILLSSSSGWLYNKQGSCTICAGGVFSLLLFLLLLVFFFFWLVSSFLHPQVLLHRVHHDFPVRLRCLPRARQVRLPLIDMLSPEEVNRWAHLHIYNNYNNLVCPSGVRTSPRTMRRRFRNSTNCQSC
jgi:hypothetical protein